MSHLNSSALENGISIDNLKHDQLITSMGWGRPKGSAKVSVDFFHEMRQCEQRCKPAAERLRFLPEAV